MLQFVDVEGLQRLLENVKVKVKPCFRKGAIIDCQVIINIIYLTKKLLLMMMMMDFLNLTHHFIPSL